MSSNMPSGMENRSSQTSAPPMICPRCKERDATIKSRNNSLCEDCFMNYVGRQVAKNMASYKVRGDRPPHKMLLALSFGTSSLTMLHLLAERLKESIKRTGRYGYTLDVLFVDDMSVFKGAEESAEGPLDKIWSLRERFDQKIYPMVLSFAWHSTQSFFDSIGLKDPDLADLIAGLGFGDAEAPATRGGLSGSSPYQKYIASLPSLSSQVDANDIITRRCIVRYAKEQGCEAILWGDTTTRLAERTLAEAAKGRGHSIPWQACDGPSPYGVDFLFPMRDLLRKEAKAYANLTAPPLTALAREELSIGTAQVSSKDATIDALMAQYFQSVEENYPSIVTNVVRTSGKLKPGMSGSERACQLCGLPVPSGEQGLHGWAGSQQDDQEVKGDFLCYGCARTSKGRR